MMDAPVNTATPARVVAANDLPKLHAHRRALFAPLIVFAVIAVFLAIGLTLDPGKVPSVLIGKPVPAFSLPPLQGRSLGLATSDLKDAVSLVNVFASWCVACRDEHPLLTRISGEAIIPVHGLNYKDAPDRVRFADARCASLRSLVRARLPAKSAPGGWPSGNSLHPWDRVRLRVDAGASGQSSGRFSL